MQRREGLPKHLADWQQVERGDQRGQDPASHQSFAEAREQAFCFHSFMTAHRSDSWFSYHPVPKRKEQKVTMIPECLFRVGLKIHSACSRRVEEAEIFGLLDARDPSSRRRLQCSNTLLEKMGGGELPPLRPFACKQGALPTIEYRVPWRFACRDWLFPACFVQ